MERVRIDGSGGILTITLNRPEKKNAVNEALLQDLDAALAVAEADPEARVAVIAGAGGAFCAGADIQELSSYDRGEMRCFHDFREGVFARLERLPFPTVAAVDGFALGTGLELALAADFRVASEEALFGVPSARLGIVESYEYLGRLVRAVGAARARFLVFTSERIRAEEARAIGLVERVCPAGRLAEEVHGLAVAIASNAPGALARTKTVIGVCARDPYLATVADPGSPMVDSVGGEMAERTRAFLERKR